uniref:membrane-bound transcription factor site-2 protease isoform X1 n=2 Tax=Ciona intestinalis TaxID=7719 RepID=UPI0000521802|nr:membrane-bound transcription factor site-2 protease isoform X1 [Ciona intestinalis]|eukprot:XP_026690055.1 membrane-bound transcription factor site-2 protease isoform X1 [Ciona intestinalis]
MLPTTFLAVILACWSIFHLLHNFVTGNEYLGPICDRFLKKRSIFVTPFQVRYFTKKLNRYLAHFGRWRKLKVWFDAGILFAALAMLSSTILLIHTLVKSFLDLNIFTTTPAVPSSQVLTVIVPGVNLPLNDLSYLLTAILLSGILHELGHAVAATREGIEVNGFGIFLFVIYPGAYVDLNSTDLNRANARKQLRVYCAGVWHNFILCLIACVLIFSLPFMLAPFYSQGGEGVIVTYQAQNSPLQGSSGIMVGDVVQHIGNCHVQESKTWFKCVNESRTLPQMGSCIKWNELEKLTLKSSVVSSIALSEAGTLSDGHPDCCGVNPPPTHLCYHYKVSQKKMFACLPGRTMMSFKDCTNNVDCGRHDQAVGVEGICAFPLLGDTTTRFMRLKILRYPNLPAQHVLYLGEPADLVRFLTISEYRPRWWWLPLRLPAVLLKFLQYMFSMSGALAVLNIVPCYALDGQWAFKSFLDFFYGRHPDLDNFKERVSTVVLCCGTLLVTLNVIFGFLNVFIK